MSHKIVLIIYDNPGVFTLYDKESDIDQDTLQAMDSGEADLIRFSERGGGCYEHAILDTNEAEGDDEEDEVFITSWQVIE